MYKLLGIYCLLAVCYLSYLLDLTVFTWPFWLATTPISLFIGFGTAVMENSA